MEKQALPAGLDELTRRRFLSTASSKTAAVALIVPAAGTVATAAAAEEKASVGLFQALGTRVGEIDQTSAVVWTRLTNAAERNQHGLLIKPAGRKRESAPSVPVEQIEGACPGAAGRVRLRYSLDEALHDAAETEWVDVDSSG